MCEPMSIAMAGLQAATTIAGGFASAQEGRYQAKLARMQGIQDLQVAAANAERARYSAERGTAALRVKMFTSGVDPASESAVATIAEDRGNRYLDELTTFYQGRVQQWEQEVKAVDANRRGKQALYSSLLSAGGTLLGTAINDGWFKGSAKFASSAAGAGRIIDAPAYPAPTMYG